MKPQITVEAIVHAPIEKVWEYWTKPEHITQWAFASDDWQAPRATTDVKVGGKFSVRMEAKNGSIGFDWGGVYTEVEPMKKMAYEFDGRKVSVTFVQEVGGVKITESFDPEDVNSIEVQKEGWQAILNNFKKHTESN